MSALGCFFGGGGKQKPDESWQVGCDCIRCLRRWFVDILVQFQLDGTAEDLITETVRHLHKVTGNLIFGDVTLPMQRHGAKTSTDQTLLVLWLTHAGCFDVGLRSRTLWMQRGTRHARLTCWLKMFSMSWRNVPFEWKNREEEDWRGGDNDK